MFEIIPETQIRQNDYERENSKLGKKNLAHDPTQILPNQEKERTF